MAALGEDFSYPYLMGVSGAAFRVQMHQPNWCPSAPCAVVGYDCVPGAMKATGYKLSWMPVQRASDKEQAKAQGLPTLQASIERGIAVIYSSEEASLAVGFGQNGQRIIRQYVANGPGYVTTDDWPWYIGVIEPHELPMERRAVVAQSLHLAVTLAKTERFGQYHSGFAALRKWADDLEDDARFDALTQGNWFPIAHGNGYCYGSLWSARFNAERYLREVAEGYEDLAKSRLLDLAGLYQQMHQTLARTKPEFECIWSLQPWNLKSPASWTRAVRLKEAALLREALQIEQQAIPEIEKLLPLLEDPAQASDSV